MRDDSVEPVQLFVTCVVDALRPEVGEATVRLLRAAGCAVGFPRGQTCCGQPAFNAGFPDEAARIAAVTVAALDATTGAVVVPSGSCAAMLAVHVPGLPMEPEAVAAARRVAARVVELSRFLVRRGWRPAADHVDATVATHPSCHALRELGIRAEPEALISATGVRGCDIEDAEDCCGFGGLFSIEEPEVSVAIMNEKLDRIEAAGCDTVVGVDASCLLHLEAGARRRGLDVRFRHLAEFLDRAP